MFAVDRNYFITAKKKKEIKKKENICKMYNMEFHNMRTSVAKRRRLLLAWCTNLAPPSSFNPPSLINNILRCRVLSCAFACKVSLFRRLSADSATLAPFKSFHSLAHIEIGETWCFPNIYMYLSRELNRYLIFRPFLFLPAKYKTAQPIAEHNGIDMHETKPNTVQSQQEKILCI